MRPAEGGLISHFRFCTRDFAMTPKKLTDELSVSAQISPDDVREIARLGFKSIISNRPDGEGAGQPGFAEIEHEAQANGLSARYIPLESGTLDEATVADFGAALAELPKPILAYCRSGTRCTMLWALSEAGQLPIEDILSKASAAGYDMSGIASRLS
jgi:sulfide:quinone oxidoreductase